MTTGIFSCRTLILLSILAKLFSKSICIKYSGRIKNTPKVYQYDRLNACLGSDFEVKTMPARFILNEFTCNTRFKIEEWQKDPIPSFTKAKDKYYYTVAMLDPLPDHSYYLHWLLVNIKGDDMDIGIVHKKNMLARYKPPTFPDHTYQFLVFLQNNRVREAPVPEQDRTKFEFFNWLKTRRGTTFIGPLAGLQFRLGFKDISGMDFSGFAYKEKCNDADLPSEYEGSDVSDTSGA
uniref:Phosphatidylethanolamine-binding protein n=1 Tax=Clastoptera arizonana TaxID=38151 RepID=A0A1B6CIZ1_9HEMI